MPRSFTPAEQFPVDSRKQQIVETVLQLVATRGTEAVSAQLVADAIGVTQPAVFRHFPTKEAIWLAVLDWLGQRLVAVHSGAGQEGEPAPVLPARRVRAPYNLIQGQPPLAQPLLAGPRR